MARKKWKPGGLGGRGAGLYRGIAPPLRRSPGRPWTEWFWVSLWNKHFVQSLVLTRAYYIRSGIGLPTLRKSHFGDFGLPMEYRKASQIVNKSTKAVSWNRPWKTTLNLRQKGSPSESFNFTFSPVSKTYTKCVQKWGQHEVNIKTESMLESSK